MFNIFNISRRNSIVLVAAVLIISLFLVTGCSQQEADSEGSGSARPVDLNFGHFYPPMHPVNVNILEPFAEEVAERTDGRVNIFIYPGNELSGAAENFDATVSGVIDISLTLPSYTPGRFPLTEILEYPFMFTSPLQSNLTAAELMETNPIFKETEYKDVKVLWYGTTDLGHILTNEPINSLDDLRGLRLRSPSTIGNDVIEALGAVPVTMPVPEVYDSIERGIVDGTLMPVSALNSFSLAEVVDNILEVNAYASPLHMVANKSSWNRISPEDQDIILELVSEFPQKIGELYTTSTDSGFNRAGEAGIPVNTLSPEEMEKFNAALEPLIDGWLDDLEAQGLPAREVYEEVRSIAGKYE